jgi:serine/threonine protein kinase
MTSTDRNSLVIVLDRAENGDLKSFYGSLIDLTKKGKVFKWHPSHNEIDGKHGGIESILDWKEVSAADRMLLVFQLSSALKIVHFYCLLHRDIKPENVMIDKHRNIKLADFGGTKDEASI